MAFLPVTALQEPYGAPLLQDSQYSTVQYSTLQYISFDSPVGTSKLEIMADLRSLADKAVAGDN